MGSTNENRFSDLIVKKQRNMFVSVLIAISSGSGEIYRTLSVDNVKVLLSLLCNFFDYIPHQEDANDILSSFSW